MSLILKFALSSAFNTLYCVNFEFPTNIASQTIGLPNTIARFVTVVASLIVSSGGNNSLDSSQHKTIQVICLVLAAISGCFTMFLDMNFNDNKRNNRDEFKLNLGK